MAEGHGYPLVKLKLKQTWCVCVCSSQTFADCGQGSRCKGRPRCHSLLWRSGWLEWCSHGLPTRETKNKVQILKSEFKFGL
jgi:hypothetical protein